MLQSLYAKCQSCVKVGASSSSAFKINKGLRQGCYISLLYLKCILSEFFTPGKEKGMGISIGADFLYTLM